MKGREITAFRLIAFFCQKKKNYNSEKKKEQNVGENNLKKRYNALNEAQLSFLAIMTHANN